MNRTIIYLLACMFGILTVQSIEPDNSNETETGNKSYMPVLEVGKIWTYRTYCGPNICPVETFRVKAADKIIEDGREIYLLEWLDTDFENTVKAYEEDGVVYMDYSEYCAYVPMIDFNLEVGDVTEEEGTITCKENVVIEGIERCLMTIERGTKKYWCEGIGAISDHFITVMMRMSGGHGCTMTECWMADKCLYNEKSLDNYNCNVDVTAEETTDDNIYDIFGRQISEPIPGHLYIKNGKKLIAN